MKTLILTGLVACLMLAPVAATAQSAQGSPQAPPVAQPLVREGDLAVNLVQALRIGSTDNEAEAESMLASAGIAPRNGWLADYPVTPDVYGELWNAVGSAADSGKLALSRDEAQRALQDIASGEGIPIEADTGGDYASNQPPPDYNQYMDPSAINDYYDNAGPPVVTYYPPPWDYYYMYGWVPSPFWWYGAWFPGFFILNDFDFVHHHDGHDGHHGHHGHDGHHDHGAKHVTNHVTDPSTHRVTRVDPANRIGGHGSRNVTANNGGRGGFGSSQARSGAESILKRSLQREGPDKMTGGVSAQTNRDGMQARSGRGPEGPFSRNSDTNVVTRSGSDAGNRTPISAWARGSGRDAGQPVSRGMGGTLKRPENFANQGSRNLNGSTAGIARPFRGSAAIGNGAPEGSRTGRSFGPPVARSGVPSFNMSSRSGNSSFSPPSHFGNPGGMGFSRPSGGGGGGFSNAPRTSASAPSGGGYGGGGGGFSNAPRTAAGAPSGGGYGGGGGHSGNSGHGRQ